MGIWPFSTKQSDLFALFEFAFKYAFEFIPTSYHKVTQEKKKILNQQEYDLKFTRQC